VEGKTLPLRAAAVTGDAEGGLARVVLRQTFANPHAEPLTVTYLFPLPADGAVAGYEFRIGERRVTGQIDRREAARERYERALVEGRTAGLLDQERANLFTQAIGNVPPGQEVVVELRIDQRLHWLALGMWEWRFPTVVPPRYQGGPGRVGDADRVFVEVADRGTDARATDVRATLDLLVRDPVPAEGRLESGTHSIRAEERGPGLRVTLADPAGASLDRDLVVRWPVARPASGVTLRRARPAEGSPHAASAYGLLTIVPPEAAGPALPRDLVLLLDTSGSMGGRPLDLAKQVATGLVGSLTPSDRLEMIAFAGEPRRWRRGAVAADPDIRRQAVGWIGALQAGGGTEMTRAIEEALVATRAEATRQVVLLTDGQISFESEVFRAIRDRLPAGSRLHAVGIGTGVNRALLAPAARAGRGVEVIVDLDEAPERGVDRILAATCGPVLTDVQITGSAVTGLAPRRVPDLLSGAPILAGVRLRAEGGELIVRARSASGEWSRTVAVPPTATGDGSDAITALHGREAIEDLELDRAAGADTSEIDRTIERIGMTFGLATRLTSWVAVSEEPTVDPRRPVRIERMPQELPYGLSAEGLGLRFKAQRVMLMGVADAQLFDQVAPGLPSATRDRRAAPIMAARSLGRAIKDALIKGKVPPTDEPELMEQDLLVDRIRVSGRWLAGPADGVQILEVEAIDRPIDWQPVASVRLTLRDGRKIDCALDRQLTTAAARLEPGMAFRIALQLSAEVREQVTEIAIDLGMETLHIVP
ncbi:MAG TPA: VIT domain-containing protein, partial [Candidatus Polarisedimenticolia bacterium]|nr:VIT domain-containing protein [Candidatus Polarisedimenticolia bacterium]